MLNEIYQLIAVPWSAILRRPITTKASGFTLTQSDKVKTFLDTLVKASKEDKYKERVNKLTRSFQQHGHTSDNIRKYQQIYNAFIKLAGSHAAKVARCKFGYERSPELTQKGALLLLHKHILDCKHRNSPITPSIQRHTTILGADPEISINRKLTTATKGAHQPFDSIQIPTHDWFYSEQQNELYQYKQGNFKAHPSTAEGTAHTFKTHHTLKVLPPDAILVK